MKLVKEGAYLLNGKEVVLESSNALAEIAAKTGKQISKEEAKMLVVSMMIDTVSFRSAKTVEYETNIAYQIAEEYKLNYDEIEKYYNENIIYKIKIDINELNNFKSMLENKNIKVEEL